LTRVLITGATRGIGRAIAERALKDGFEVHLIARTSDSLERVAGELSKLGQVAFTPVNMARREELQRFCERWRGPLHGIVNNVGAWREDSLLDADMDVLVEMMSLNVFGMFGLTKGLYGHLLPGGRVVNISSQLGVRGRELMGSYAATKHAIIGLTRSWAPEAARRGITVNAVCPGWVDTQSNQDELSVLAARRGRTLEQEMQTIAQGLVLGRFIRQEEVASLVAFLLSPDSSGVTAQAYEIL